MLRKFIIVLAVLLVSGCQGTGRDSSPVVIDIEGIEITQDEFEQAFSRSAYAGQDSPEVRRAFLDNLVVRRLMLKEAEKRGLDRDPEFLKDVELFWQQSLLKLILDKKINELGVKVSEQEIKEYYLSHKNTLFKDKSLAQVKRQINRVLLIRKKKQAISEWADSLTEDSEVEIDYQLLGIEE